MQAQTGLQAVRDSIGAETNEDKAVFKELFHPAMRLVLTIGLAVAILQQITGIDSVFFYAPMIFEQSGIGTDASFLQAILVGLVNLVFTVLAILPIDRLGRRPLLALGLAGIAVCMLVLSYGFGSATYTLDDDAVASLSQTLDRESVAPLLDETYQNDVAFRRAIVDAAGSTAYQDHQSELVSAAISMNPTPILIGILGFVASFAISLGPVMWVLFSELFPNRLRGLAISAVGLVNSAVSFTVQLIFPWELERLGNSLTFLIYAAFAIVGLVIVIRLVPETKGRSLEELEAELVRL